MAVTVVLALVAGCTPVAADDPASTPANDESRASLNAAAGVYVRLVDVLNRLYDKCMAGKGFTVHPRHEPVDPASFTAKEPPLDRPENLDDARKYGYRISAAPEVAPTEKVVEPDPFDAQPEEVRRQYAEGLTGPGNPNRGERTRPGDKERDVFVMPDGNKQFVYKQGCQPETDRAVLGDVKRFVELRYAATSGLDHAVHNAAAADPGASAARAAWISCMSGRGYPGVTDSVDAARKAESYYENVDQANADAVRQARDSEIEQAVAHAQCAEQTRVNEALQAAWNRELATYLATHEADLVAWQEFSEASLTRAQQMLAS
ncbi:hypothetical protein [Actinophytocola sp.]|uniref:hypothetical protein n=1 Tax=Actinophytocola sp. TaxID=1872138 RepID=UPI002ED28B45